VRTVSETVQSSVETDEYGIPVDLFDSTTRIIRRNDTFSGVLSSFGLDSEVVQSAIATADGTFDVRKIQLGREVTHYAPLNPGAPSLVIYEIDPTSFVIFSFSDSVSVEVRKRDIQTRMRHVEGVIKGSLYETLIKQGASPALAVTLSEVYAWQIDFYRIQRGDAFKVFFEEETMDGKSIGVGRIQSAWFKHAGKEFVALYFEQDGKGDYYDAEGNSLRKAFLKAPLSYSRISSRFTNRRFHPVLKRNIPHHGTDYAAPTGTPIRAVGDAIVSKARYDNANGNHVRLKHNGTYETGYLHMSRIAPGIRAGARVTQGQIIGYVGSTGLATGPHLCYRFWVNGVPSDPHKVEFPSSTPIADEYRAQFNLYRSERIAELTRPAMLPHPGNRSLAITESAIAPIPSTPIFSAP
jgi:murein DD-endopeptidase MepM/ murein hydrolase activator NlpD